MGALIMRDQKVLTRREMLFCAASMIIGQRVIHSQEIPRAASPNFSVNVEVVNVFVTVRDKKGKIVNDLMREDFTLGEDGRMQIIRYFSRESDLPLTIGLIVDTTPSESNMLEEERNASRIFLNSLIRAGTDNAFLIQFGNEVELLQDLTSSREKLERALNRLERHEMGAGGTGRGGRGGLGPNSTVLADSVYLASDEIMKPQQGRKALIILGDGDHIGDRMEMAITAAQQADTIIYAIRIYDRNFGGGGGGLIGVIGMPPMGGPRGGRAGGSGPGGPVPGGNRGLSDGKDNLKKLSGQTGGRYFEATKKETLEEIYRQIEEDLRSQYNLGYTPDDSARKGYRRIKISVQKKGLVVHGREGYYR
jgi:VWFA-related protein